MTCMAQYLLTHKEQILFSCPQKAKHILGLTHIFQYKMSLSKCTEQSSLHKTQRSDSKSNVHHFKTLLFKT